ncbi:MAG TPA: recombinase family protein [Segetibacter sp.]
MNNVIIYTRVSTDEQAEKGYSLAAQKELLTKYCKQRGWNLVGFFSDDFSAWKGFDRPGYNKLRSYIAQNKGKVSNVLFTQWSRFSRDYTEAAVEIKHLRKLGIEPNAVEQWIDFSIPENLYLLAFYLTAPQVENDRLSQRTKSGMRQALKEGRWLWKAPYGYTNNRATKLIEVHPEQSAVVKFCFDLMATGVFKAEEVRRKAQEKGCKFHKQGFLNMLQNVVYTGKIVVPAFKDEPEELRIGLHQPLVDEAVFTAVQDVLKGKKKPYKGNTKDDCLPLIGMLYCPKCNKPMTGSGSRGNGGIYHYYHCQRKYGCNNSIKADLANNSFHDFLKIFEPVPEVLELYDVILKDVFKSNEIDREEEKAKNAAELVAIEKKLQTLVLKNLDGIIDDDTYQSTKEVLQNQKNEYLVKKETLKNLPDDFSKYLTYGFSLIGNLSHYYTNAEVKTKKKIIGSIFPEKIFFENNSYRTTKINSVIELLFNAGATFRNKNRSEISDLSTVAPPSGLEPETL